MPFLEDYLIQNNSTMSTYFIFSTKYGLRHGRFVSWNRQALDLLKFCDKRVNGYLASIEILNVSKYGEVVRQCYFDI